MISLKVAGKNIERFNDVQISLKYDSVASTFSFVYWFDPFNNELKDLNTFGNYTDAVVLYNNEPIITGQIINYSHEDSSVKVLSQISGYSTPGVLEDCEIPTTNYPLQTNGKSLANICKDLCRPFKINVIIDADVANSANKAIDTSAADPSQTIKAYLAQLASQRNIILSHDNLGNLLLTRAKAKSNPIFQIDSGGFGITGMSLVFPGQSMHSEITAIKQVGANGGNAGQSSVSNPFVDKFRPKIVIQSSGDDNTTSSVAKQALANEISGIVLNISFSSWEYNEILLQPNKIISVKNTEIGLPNVTKWFIEEVTLSGNQESQTAQIKCVLPESHNGQKPTNIFKA